MKLTLNCSVLRRRLYTISILVCASSVWLQLHHCLRPLTQSNRDTDYIAHTEAIPPHTKRKYITRINNAITRKRAIYIGSRFQSWSHPVKRGSRPRVGLTRSAPNSNNFDVYDPPRLHREVSICKNTARSIEELLLPLPPVVPGQNLSMAAAGSRHISKISAVPSALRLSTSPFERTSTQIEY